MTARGIISRNICVFSVSVCTSGLVYNRFGCKIGQRCHLYPLTEFESYIQSDNLNFHFFVTHFRFGKNLIFGTGNSQGGGILKTLTEKINLISIIMWP